METMPVSINVFAGFIAALCGLPAIDAKALAKRLRVIALVTPELSDSDQLVLRRLAALADAG